MKILIVKEHWANLILSGKKSWEIRSRNTSVRGRVGIAISGTGKVFGSVEIIDSIGVTYSDMLQNKENHKIEDHDLIFKYPVPKAWVMVHPEKFEEPVTYNHKQGAVIWVNDEDLEV